MRWFAWLVALCLLAAGGARPHVARTLDRHDATVEDASELATLLPRRPSTFTTDKRADRRFDVEVSPIPIVAHPVALTLIATAVQDSPRAPALRCLAQSSRGPPATHPAVSNHTS